MQVTTCNKQLVTDLCHNCNKSCKEMGGATSVMHVNRDTFSQKVTATTQCMGWSWYHRLDGTLWLAASCKFPQNTVHESYYANEGCKTCADF